MHFSDQRQIDSFDPPVKVVIDFLTSLYENNVGYSGINTAKSAISSICAVLTGRDIGKDNLIVRFMRGIYNCRPSLPRYTETWDVSLVLNYLDSLPVNSDLSLIQLSKKLATLFMLLSAQRCQTVHLIKHDNISIQDDKMTVYILDLVKQSKPGTHIEPLVFPRFSNDKLCIVKTTEDYLLRTEKLRKSTEKQLFLSSVTPFKAVTKSTIANWIKDTMDKAGINIKVFATHSCRSASSSSVAKQGIPIDNIMKSVGWNSAQTFFKFYFKPVQKQTLSEHILNQAAKCKK